MLVGHLSACDRMSTLLIECRCGSYWVIDETESMTIFEDDEQRVLFGGVVPIRHLDERGNDLPVPGRPERIGVYPRPVATSTTYEKKGENSIKKFLLGVW